MSYRKKILIIEHDDFLREIIGNLLHKEGVYVLNGFCIEDGLTTAKNKKIDTVVLGMSCEQHKGKNSLRYIQKSLGHVEFFLLNNTNKEVDFVPSDMQMKVSELSINDIIKKLV